MYSKSRINIGDKFGKLTIIEIESSRNNYCLCKCECGNIIERKIDGLFYTKSKSRISSCNKCRITVNKHNMSNGKHKLYQKWLSMKDRCCNTNNERYKNYGKRGIIVCKDCTNDYLSFYNWAINNGYKEGLTIERKDPNGNYCPENCCWIPMKDQSQNKTNTVYILAFEETKTIRDWSTDLRCKVSYDLLRDRIKKSWDAEQAITQPKSDKFKNNKNKYITFNKCSNNWFFRYKEKTIKCFRSLEEAIEFRDKYLETLIIENLF